MSNSTRSSEFVVDTIGLVLYLEKRKMGSSASGVFEGVEVGRGSGGFRNHRCS